MDSLPNFIFNVEIYASAILGYVVFKIAPKIEWLMGFFLSALVKKMPREIRKYYRKRKLDKTLKVRRDRRSIAAVNYQIARANSYFMMFVGVCAIFFLMLIFSPTYKEIFKYSLWAGVITTFPIYVMEMFWLHHDYEAKNLIKQYNRIGRKSNR